MTQFSHSLIQRDIRNVLHPYTNVASHGKMESLITTTGERIYVLDEVDNK
jgi:adenosylmethionine-8-amino-7-oxononanoate aminotransferase